MWKTRVETLANAVIGRFGRPLLGLPGTHIAGGPWHYWWQAHYMDCLVDAGRMDLAACLLNGIWLRNGGRFVNDFYDDMAWLALAALRLEQHRPDLRRTRYVRRVLSAQLEAACTGDLGGGTFWSKRRDYKNTPATASTALYFARTGRSDQAQSLLDWLDANLYDPVLGLYLDGLHLTVGGPATLDRGIYTYNQGPVLGTLLNLGGQANLTRAADLVDAVAARLTVTDIPASPLLLRDEGGGDRGLFTGILTRYLALAAQDLRLPAVTRIKARAMILDTAAVLWQRHAPDSAAELSIQLQAWLVCQAAAIAQSGS